MTFQFWWWSFLSLDNNSGCFGFFLVILCTTAQSIWDWGAGSCVVSTLESSQCQVWTLTLHHSNIHVFFCISKIRPPVTEMNLLLLQRRISALVSSHMGPGGLHHEPPPNSCARCENDVLQAEVQMKVNSVTFSAFISSFHHYPMSSLHCWISFNRRKSFFIRSFDSSFKMKPQNIEIHAGVT